MDENELQNNVFYDNKELYRRLSDLNSLKKELMMVKDKIEKPILITILGSPRTGKTSISFNIYDFLKKCGMNIAFFEEPANEVYKLFKTDEEKKKAIGDLGAFNTLLMHSAIDKVKSKLEDPKVKIIIYDRGFLDSFVWFNMCLNKGQMTDTAYMERSNELQHLSLDVYNLTFALYANPMISIRRDYLSSLSLEKRKFITEENLNEYISALFRARNELAQYSDLCHYIDTSSINLMDTSINIAENICYTLINNSKVYKG